MANTDVLRAKMAAIAELREADRKISEVKKSNTEMLDQAESEMVEMLTEAGLPNFRCDIGLASVSHRTSVQTPKTPEDRQAFFDYLKAKGLFESMITVNSATLNSFYKDGMKDAADKGEDFEVPGIAGVTVTPILSFQKA